MALLTQIQALASQLLPQRQPDANILTPRADAYGNLAVNSFFNKKQALAAEGSAFVTTNPTPGTAFADAVSASYAVTAPFAIFQNLNPQGGSNAFLDYLKLIPTVAPASGTQAYFAAVRDNIATALTTNNMNAALRPANLNPASPIGSNCRLLAQNSATASALAALSPQAQVIGRGAVGGLPVVGDELVFDFGAIDPAAYQGLTAAQATCPGRKVSVLPPIVVAPQQQVIFYLWFPSNTTTGLSYEFELTHFER